MHKGIIEREKERQETQNYNKKNETFQAQHTSMGLKRWGNSSNFKELPHPSPPRFHSHPTPLQYLALFHTFVY